MKKELTCIACPLGCTITVTLDGKDVISVEGNTCPRGKEYAINECTAPVRTVTTTVKCEDGDVILPAIPEFIKEIDTERGVFIKPIPGFFPEK